MAFNRFTTKLGQAVTGAGKTEMDPALKEGLRQFDETTKLGDHSKDAAKEALPIVGSNSKVTKIEALGNLMKQSAAKYGLDKPEHQGLHAGGQLLMGIGKVERELLQKVEQEAYAHYEATHDFNESLKKEKTKLEHAMTWTAPKSRTKAEKEISLKSKRPRKCTRAKKQWWRRWCPPWKNTGTSNAERPNRWQKPCENSTNAPGK